MTIRLSKEQERFVRDAVRSSRYAREDDVVRDAFDRLMRSTPEEKPLAPDELNRRLLESGLVSRLPDPSADVDDDDPPIAIEGEPLSETIVRERR